MFSTGVGEALAFSAAQFGPVGDCGRRVIDVSGDGRSNEGRAPKGIGAALAEAGFTVNGLAITGSEPFLEQYFRDNVIAGPGAFVLAARGYSDYPEAIRRKLHRGGDEAGDASAAAGCGGRRRGGEARARGGGAGARGRAGGGAGLPAGAGARARRLLVGQQRGVPAAGGRAGGGADRPGGGGGVRDDPGGAGGALRLRVERHPAAAGGDRLELDRGPGGAGARRGDPARDRPQLRAVSHGGRPRHGATGRRRSGTGLPAPRAPSISRATGPTTTGPRRP